MAESCGPEKRSVEGWLGRFQQWRECGREGCSFVSSSVENRRLCRLSARIDVPISVRRGQWLVDVTTCTFDQYLLRAWFQVLPFARGRLNSGLREVVRATALGDRVPFGCHPWYNPCSDGCFVRATKAACLC